MDNQPPSEKDRRKKQESLSTGIVFLTLIILSGLIMVVLKLLNSF